MPCSACLVVLGTPIILPKERKRHCQQAGQGPRRPGVFRIWGKCRRPDMGMGLVGSLPRGRAACAQLMVSVWWRLLSPDERGRKEGEVNYNVGPPPRPLLQNEDSALPPCLRNFQGHRVPLTLRALLLSSTCQGQTHVGLLFSLNCCSMCLGLENTSTKAGRLLDLIPTQRSRTASVRGFRIHFDRN